MDILELADWFHVLKSNLSKTQVKIGEEIIKEIIKFKIDAADTVAGYWTDKITIGSGLSGSVNTDPSGEKTLTISAVSVF